MRNTDTRTATHHTSRVAALPLEICPICMTTMPAHLASTSLTEDHPSLCRQRKIADWWSPIAMGQEKASPPKADTLWSCLSWCTKVLPAMPALPQRTCVWKKERSATHTLWTGRKQMSESNLLWVTHHEISHWLRLSLFRISVYHAPIKEAEWAEHEQNWEVSHAQQEVPCCLMLQERLSAN